MSYLPSSPSLVNLSGLLSKYPRCGILLFELLEDIKNSFSPLSKEMREVLIAFISQLNRCEFCYPRINKPLVSSVLMLLFSRSYKLI